MQNSKLSKEQRRYIHKGVRIRYPHIFDAQSTKYVTRKHYSIQVLLGATPEAPAYKAYEQHLLNCLKVDFGDAAERIFSEWRKDKTYRIQFSEDLGQFYVTIRRWSDQGRPAVFDEHNAELDAMDGRPKSGDYCDVMEDSWTFDKGSRSRGVSGTLMGVRFQKEGDPIGGAPTAKAGDWDNFGAKPVDPADFI